VKISNKQWSNKAGLLASLTQTQTNMVNGTMFKKKKKIGQN